MQARSFTLGVIGDFDVTAVTTVPSGGIQSAVATQTGTVATKINWTTMQMYEPLGGDEPNEVWKLRYISCW